MKVRLITMSLVLIFSSSSVYALIGTSTAELGKGQWSVGCNYLYTSQDLDTVKVKENDGDRYNLGISDFNIHRYYAQLNYGINDIWEVYGQLGTFDIKAKYKGLTSYAIGGVNFDNEILYGLGTKYTFAKKEKIDWGATFQMNMLSTSVSEKYSNGTKTMDVDIDIMELVLGVGPTVVMGGWNLYGGALCSILSIDHDSKDSDGDKGTGDNETESLGGYVGAQLDVYKNYNMSIELQATDNGWGVGAGITIPF